MVHFDDGELLNQAMLHVTVLNLSLSLILVDPILFLHTKVFGSSCSDVDRVIPVKVWYKEYWSPATLSSCI